MDEMAQTRLKARAGCSGGAEPACLSASGELRAPYGYAMTTLTDAYAGLASAKTAGASFKHLLLPVEFSCRHNTSAVLAHGSIK
jgi:hypothetical protein